ncbi:MAG TPA: 16S rRNA (cytosine(1402)-N(4))-methyltransferase RsmH [Candidatus Ozemobacteraceae bacterium]|nr:16S rRNA (cytosine(1402)-N(4))-methyltransferase RsmH [Candidatus Ozemobacteraceae bacterium]
MTWTHAPVLLDPILNLGVSADCRTFVDLTFGLGGHAQAILQRFPDIRLYIGVDRDREILQLTDSEPLDPRIRRLGGRASDVESHLSACGLVEADDVLMDLGVCSVHFDNRERGFSFQGGPLDMRLERTMAVSAREVVNEFAERDLAHILKQFGEEPFARQIARHIVRRRAAAPIETNADLAAIVEAAIPVRIRARMTVHPATRTFQAIRIQVNDELQELEAALEAIYRVLRPGGRMSIISFHSLEDRIVKQFLVRKAKGCVCPPHFPVCACGFRPQLKILTRKPMEADESEIRQNPRSRSAKLRIAEKLP